MTAMETLIMIISYGCGHKFVNWMYISGATGTLMLIGPGKIVVSVHRISEGRGGGEGEFKY